MQAEANPSETTDSEDLAWALGVLLRSYRETIDPVLDDFPYGQRGYQTLCEVVRGDHPSQLALANHLGIDRTVMTYLIDDLVGAGLVERHPNPDDRRQRQIVATAPGRQVIARLCADVARAEQQVLETLDTAERGVFRELLMKAAASR